MVSWKNELQILFHPYFLVNYFMGGLFCITKTLPPLCTHMYENCHLEIREYELLIFLACVITLKNKRQISIPTYMDHFCMFAKICNAIMFFQQNIFYAILFSLVWLIQASFLHLPVYRGPDKVLFFRDNSLEEEVLKGDPRITWIIEFYTAWSPACVSFAPMFAEISQDYGLDNLKFGKIDVTRYPAVARKFSIDTSSWSKQLPTVILFRCGKEVERRPAINMKGQVMQKFSFTWENMVRSLGLNELRNECQKNPISKKKAVAAAHTAPAGGTVEAESKKTL